MSKKFLFAFLAILLGVYAFAGQITAYDPMPGEAFLSMPEEGQKEAKALGFLVDITSPATTVINPVAFEPSVQILNITTETLEDIWIRLSVKDVLTGDVAYRDSVQVTDSLASAADTEIVFPAFTPLYLKQYMMYAEVWKDTFDGVDTIYFSTYDADAAPTTAYDPTSPQNYLSDYTPNADFSNNGTQTLTFYAHCDIFEGGSKVYSDSVLITDLTAGNTSGISFRTFYAPHIPGTSTIYFYTNMKHDVDRTNDTISYDIIINNPLWTALDPSTSLPTQWAGRCMDEDGNLYIVAGFDQSGVGTNNVQVYNPASGWSVLTTTPYSCFTPSCAVIDSKLIVIDGSDGSFNAIHGTNIYDLRTSSWSSGTLSPVALLGCGGNVVDGKMYILGGNTAGVFPSTITAYSYDISADTAGGTPWQTLTTYWPGHGVLLGSFFYGTPGEDKYAYITGDYQGYHDFYRYEPEADTVGGNPWVTLAPTPADVGGKNPSLIVDNGEVFVVGGDYLGSWGAYSNKAYKYDDKGDVWTDIGFNLNTTVEGNVAWKVADTLYTHSGTVGSYAINPPPFEMCILGTAIDFYAPYIVSTSPYNRQVSVPLWKTVAIAFSEPVDTLLWVDAVINPDPDLVMMFWNESLDSLFIFHDDFSYNQTYYVTFDIFCDTMGYRSIEKTVPYTIGFSTGPTGVNSPYAASFKVASPNVIADANSTFDFMLYSSTNEKINVEIYSLNGSKVKDLSIDNPKSGINKVSWNMSGANGQKVSSGVYFFKVFNSKEKLEGKIIVTK